MSVLPKSTPNFRQGKNLNENNLLETVGWKVLSLAGKGYYLDKDYMLQSGSPLLFKNGAYIDPYNRQTMNVAMVLPRLSTRTPSLSSIEMKALQKLIAERHTIPSDKIKEWTSEHLLWMEQEKKIEEEVKAKKEKADAEKAKAETEAVNKVYLALFS